MAKLSQMTASSISLAATLKVNPYAKAIASQLQKGVPKLEKSTRDVQKTLSKAVVEIAEIKTSCMTAVATMTEQMTHLKAAQKFL